MHSQNQSICPLIETDAGDNVLDLTPSRRLTPTPNVHILGSRLSKNTTKIQREDTQRQKNDEMGAGEGKKRARNFGSWGRVVQGSHHHGQKVQTQNKWCRKGGALSLSRLRVCVCRVWGSGLNVGLLIFGKISEIGQSRSSPQLAKVRHELAKVGLAKVGHDEPASLRQVLPQNTEKIAGVVLDVWECQLLAPVR